MAKRGQHSFVKRQKEIKRQQKAQEKMARRQGKKDREPNEDKPDPARPDEQE